MSSSTEEVLQEIICIQHATQMTRDHSTDSVVNNLLDRAIDDLIMVQQNIYTMSEEEVASVLERTIDFVNNCGATFEIVN